LKSPIATASSLYIITTANDERHVRVARTELEFLKSLWGLGTEEEYGYHTGPPGYISWRNLFLGINSEAPKHLKIRAQAAHTFWSTGKE
jgi:hypothetical protein